MRKVKFLTVDGNELEMHPIYSIHEVPSPV